MEDFFLRLKLLSAGAAAFAVGLLGGADAALYTLVGFTIADYLTGLIKAVLRRELASWKAFQGGLKKLLIYVVVAVAAGLDRFLPGGDSLFRSLAVGYYIAAEGLSILENAALCGVPLPEKLRDALAQVRDKSR